MKTGVLDYCLEAGIRFDVGIGISAGSANISSYIAGKKKRNYPHPASERPKIPPLS